MSVHGFGNSPLANGADLDRTAEPTVIEGGFAVNNRNAMVSVGASRMLNNNFSLGAEGGVMNLNDYSFGPRPFVGANATAYINNSHGADPYVSARYTGSFGQGGMENRLGARVGISAPVGPVNLGMFVGVDRAIGTPVTPAWSANVGMTIGLRLHK